MSNIGAMTGGSSGGITGQLDVQWIVEQMIYAKQQPIRELETYEFFYEAKREAFQELNTKVSALENTLFSLNNTGFGSRTATASNDNYLTASASSTASTGEYTVYVENLAKAQSNASEGFESADDQLLSNGTFVIKDGDDNILGQVDYTGSTQSLNGIKNAVNSMGLDVTATVVNYGTEDNEDYRLHLTSDVTGTDNNFVVEETGVGTALSGSIVGTAMVQKIAAEDAQIYVNNDPTDVDNMISRSTNTISDVINGVTLNLTAEDATKTNSTLVTVGQDSGAIKENLQTFVDSFNELSEFLNSQFAYDEQNERAGVLSGEAAARQVKTDLLGVATTRVDGIKEGDDYKNFAVIGLEMTQSGKLEINESKLDDALDNHLDEVKRVLRDVGTAENSYVSYIGNTDNTTAGAYDLFVTKAAEQGVAVSDTDIAVNLAQAETLTISYGETDYSISLSNNATQTEVVTAINNAMNEVGVPVFAQINDDKLEIVTGNHGSGETVSASSDVAKADGGTGIGTSAEGGITGTGDDVEGYFQDSDATQYTASGTGRILTGNSGLTNGLKVSVSVTSVGGTEDDLGEVYFTRGVGESVRESMFELSFPYSGLLAKNIDSFDDQLKNIADKVASINRTLISEQDILVMQFSKANEALAQMSYLQSTLSNSFK
ncbi:MAG: flagellar filament capping protein FliD [bacterium]|nr:flagellar filament capping protein FliD [bacterium]